MSMDLQEQIERMAQGGWDGIDDPGAALKAAREEQGKAERREAMRQARIFADCFETPAGQLCLALLRGKTIERPPTQAELDELRPEAFALMQARRQGAANLVFTIESALDFARGLPAKEGTDG